MNKKSIIFIMNPISGTKNKDNIPQIIEETLDREKFTYEIKLTEYAGHAEKLAHEAMLQGKDIVVAVGGDGTVNEVARAIVHSDTALGIIPCGSGNGLARHLLLPMDVRKSIEILNECDIKSLDYGIINDKPFFCTCGMGFDAFISQKFAESGKRGPVSYAEQILKVGTTYKPETYEIEFEEDGKPIHLKAFLITCANACQFGNNAYIAPQASMSDGLLDVIIMEPFDILEATEIGVDMFNKVLDKNPNIRSFKCKSLTIHRSHEGVIHFDGDPVMAGADVTVSIEEKGINMVVNPFTSREDRKPNMLQVATGDLLKEINYVRDNIISHIKGRLERVKK